MPPQPITLSCTTCGQPFTVPYISQRRRRKFCSRSCAMVNRRGDWLARFWARVHKTEYCWEWMGARRPGGYGSVSLHGQMLSTHALAWQLAGGPPLQAGQQIGHTCDNPRCVRNDEIGTYLVNGVALLRLGHLFHCRTAADNSADMIAKGRQSYKPPCERPARRVPRVSPELAATIRARWLAGTSQRALATEYGLHYSYVSLIARGKRGHTLS